MGNIGKKIKWWSITLTFVGFAVIVTGFAVVCFLSHRYANEMVAFVLGVLLMGIGVGISWLSSFILYTLGEQLEQTAMTPCASPAPYPVRCLDDTTIRVESDKSSFSVAIPADLRAYIHVMPSVEYPSAQDSLTLTSTVFDDGYMMIPLFSFYIIRLADESDFKARWYKRGLILNQNGVGHTAEALKVDEGFRLVKLCRSDNCAVYAEYVDPEKLPLTDTAAVGVAETRRALAQRQDIFQSFRWETTT